MRSQARKRPIYPPSPFGGRAKSRASLRSARALGRGDGGDYPYFLKTPLTNPIERIIIVVDGATCAVISICFGAGCDSPPAVKVREREFLPNR